MSTTSSGFQRSVGDRAPRSATSSSSAARPMKSWSNFTARCQPTSTGVRRRARVSVGSTLPLTLMGGLKPLAATIAM